MPILPCQDIFKSFGISEGVSDSEEIVIREMSVSGLKQKIAYAILEIKKKKKSSVSDFALCSCTNHEVFCSLAYALSLYMYFILFLVLVKHLYLPFN